MQKRIIIGIAGAEGKEFKDLAILPNTRAIDVGTGADQNVPVIGPRPQVIGPTPSTTVIPSARLAWAEKRWEQHGSRGRIELIGPR